MNKKDNISFDEDRAIVKILDQIAVEEGTNRSAIIRKMIRRALAQRLAEQLAKQQEQPR